MEANLNITTRELIKPSSPTPHESKYHKLSFVDQLAPPCFVPVIFFYQKERFTNTVDPSQTSQHLKQSLSKSLAKFYPLAGKLKGNLSVDCDDSGALFVEAKVPAPLLQAIRNAPLEKLEQYLPFQPFDVDADNLLDAYPRNEILLAVQISCFECGGIAIGVCISHKVADLMSLVTFMNSWAAISRGGSRPGSTDPLALNEPNFELGRHLFPQQDFHLSFPQPAAKAKIVFKRFLFPIEKLSQLKQLATSSSQVKDPTRVEVVTAFLCKQFIRVARAKIEAAKAMFTIKHTVNLRGRISSLGLSNDGFPFGNLAIVTAASFRSDDDQEEKEFGDLVWHTSTSMRKVNEDYVINSVIPFLYSLGSTNGRELQQQKGVISEWFFTSWCRFPMYEVDFGWGKPISVTPSGTATRSGAVVLMDTGRGNGMEAWVAIAEDEMALLSEELLSLQITDILPLH